MSYVLIVALVIAIAWLVRGLIVSNRSADRADEPRICEVCRSAGVVRSGDWDHCPRGHSYIGKRVDV